MQRLRYALAVYVVAFVVNAVGGGETEKKEPTLSLALTLSDGSKIIGTPRMASIRLQTSYAKMEIPLKQIRDIKIEGDHETASLVLTNGDKLKGILHLKPIELETTSGKVAVNLQYITGISVYQKGKGSMPAVLKDSLVLYYSFNTDEGDKVTDASGKGHDGNVQGATWTPQGKVGGAYSFDGTDDQIEVCSKAPFDLEYSNSISISAWIYKPDVSSSPTIISKVVYPGPGNDNSSSPGWELTTVDPGDWVTSDAITFYLEGYGDGNCIQVYASNVLEANTWYHVCATYNGSGNANGIHLFKNGLELAKSVQIDNLHSTIRNDYPVLIGARNLQGLRFKGAIDEVMIFNRALSVDEVTALYNSRN